MLVKVLVASVHVTSWPTDVIRVLLDDFPLIAHGMTVDTKGKVVMGYFVVHFPDAQAVVGTHVATGWYCEVTVTDGFHLLVTCGQASMVARGWMAATAVTRAAAPKTGVSKRIVKE
jgi:hypothetical protein